MLELDVLGWMMAVIAAMSVGLAKGGLPMVGSLAVPLLAMQMNPVAAAGLLLPVYVISDLFGLYAYRHHFDPRVLKILFPATALGVIIGWATASIVPEQAVMGLVGLIGFVFALNALLRPSLGGARRAKIVPGVFWGTITGFTSFVSHSGAPPFQAYVIPLRMEKSVFAGTATITFAWVNAIKLIPYLALGQINFGSLKTALVLAIPASIAVFAGFRLVQIVPQDLFYKIVTWALLAISVQLLWKSVLG